jgi:hypothetical protein
MFKFMLTLGLILAGLAGLVRVNEIVESIGTKPVVQFEADYQDFVCSTDDQIDQAIEWLESHGYSEIAADKVAVNVWKVYGYKSHDNREDHRL